MSGTMQLLHGFVDHAPQAVPFGVAKWTEPRSNRQLRWSGRLASTQKEVWCFLHHDGTFAEYFFAALSKNSLFSSRSLTRGCSGSRPFNVFINSCTTSPLFVVMLANTRLFAMAS